MHRAYDQSKQQPGYQQSQQYYIGTARFFRMTRLPATRAARVKSSESEYAIRFMPN